MFTIAHDETANPQKAPKIEAKKSSFCPDCRNSFCALLNTIATVTVSHIGNLLGKLIGSANEASIVAIPEDDKASLREFGAAG